MLLLLTRSTSLLLLLLLVVISSHSSMSGDVPFGGDFYGSYGYGVGGGLPIDGVAAASTLPITISGFAFAIADIIESLAPVKIQLATNGIIKPKIIPQIPLINPQGAAAINFLTAQTQAIGQTKALLAKSLLFPYPYSSGYPIW